MTRGLPVIASAWGATPEIVRDGGRLVDPRDPTAAAKTILNLLDFPNRAQLVERARENSRRFDWALAAEKTRRLYARLAG
jgi:glycosyltransferase involved in cell wall biosynthesis